MLSKKRKIRKSKNYKNRFFLTLTVILFISFIGFLVFSNLRINQKRKVLNQKIENLKEQAEILEKRNKELKTGIIETETDPYWEARLYEQGFKKPDEEAIVIIPPAETEKETTVSQEKAFFEDLLDWVLMRD